MFKNLNHQGNANQDNPEIPTNTSQNSSNKNSSNAGKEVEKEEDSSIAGGIASWYNHFGNQSGGSSENRK
jgi:rare lipoprotein A (peptidoglycan hydrolase)